MITKLNYLLLIYFVCLIIFAHKIHVYVVCAARTRVVFLRSAGAARALHYSAAAGASAGGHAKPAAARAVNRFFARGA